MELRIAIAWACVAGLAACGGQGNPTGSPTGAGAKQTPIQPAGGEQGVTNSATRINDFGLRLLRAAGTDDNVLVSPVSVASALGLLAAGAEGETRSEIAAALGAQLLTPDALEDADRALANHLRRESKGTTLSIATSAWLRSDFQFEPSFLETAQSAYDAEIRTLDFAQPTAPDTINNWVNTKTNGRIPNIVEQLSDNAVLYLLNAVYFKADWAAPFDKENTKQMPFSRDEGEPVQADMMTKYGKTEYAENDLMQMVALPYADERLEFLAILPKASISDLIKALTPDALREWSNRARKRDGEVAIPKFKIEYETELKNVLRSLGIEKAFDPDGADLSGISKEHRLYVERAKHKTFIQLDEKGTEAAGATGIEVGITSISEPFTFVADRPFVYAIRDVESGLLLFVGVMHDPT